MRRKCTAQIEIQDYGSGGGYEGQMQGGDYHGQGVMSWASGLRYEEECIYTCCKPRTHFLCASNAANSGTHYAWCMASTTLLADYFACWASLASRLHASARATRLLCAAMDLLPKVREVKRLSYCATGAQYKDNNSKYLVTLATTTTTRITTPAPLAIIIKLYPKASGFDDKHLHISALLTV